MAMNRINRRMIIYKLFYFFSIAGVSITPFVGLYCKYLGLSASDIGIVTAAQPITVAVSQPIIGFLTDKWRCPRFTVSFCGTLWIGSIFAMGLAVPPLLREKSCKSIQEDFNDQEQSYLLFLNNVSAEYDETECLDLLNRIVQFQPLEEERSWIYSSKSLQNVFYILLILYSLNGLSFNPLHSIADAESVNTLQEMGIDMAEYGKQRAFGSLGWGIAPLIYGSWITLTRGCQIKCGIPLTMVQYVPVFMVCMFFAVCSVITMIFFSYKWHKEGSDSSKGLEKRILIQLCSLPNLAMIFVTTFIGMCNGTVQGFLYWHLDSLGGTELVMALASVCHGLSEFLLGLVTGVLTRRFGYFPLMTVGILTYMFRFIYYAFVKEPWWILGSELLHSLTFLLTWNTALSYLSLAVPEEYRTSLASLLNALHFGFGNAIGYLLGGYLINIYGSILVFKLYSVLCAAVSIVFVCIFMTHDAAVKNGEPNEEKHNIDIKLPRPGKYLPDYVTVHQQDAQD
ncbi:major facilitator superfamily domain-containing protein 6-like [Amphiura filiformis]|uniref:major facilitator superfamily domain-containing protein 6-like n=1 Tax=Amphiura filiformis TaxID=82378 RepID=UPI003B20EDE9